MVDGILLLKLRCLRLFQITQQIPRGCSRVTVFHSCPDPTSYLQQHAILGCSQPGEPGMSNMGPDTRAEASDSCLLCPTTAERTMKHLGFPKPRQKCHLLFQHTDECPYKSLLPAVIQA